MPATKEKGENFQIAHNAVDVIGKIAEIAIEGMAKSQCEASSLRFELIMLIIRKFCKENR